MVEMIDRKVKLSWMLFEEEFLEEHVLAPPKKVYEKEPFRRRSRRLLEKRKRELKKDKAVGALVMEEYPFRRSSRLRRMHYLKIFKNI